MLPSLLIWFKIFFIFMCILVIMPILALTLDIEIRNNVTSYCARNIADFSGAMFFAAIVFWTIPTGSVVELHTKTDNGSNFLFLPLLSQL